MSDLRAVLWDLDGVLVDTGDFHFKAWKTTLSNHRIDFSYEKFRQTFGMNNEGMLRIILGEQYTNRQCIELSCKKETLFREIIAGKLSLLPGVEDLLKEIRTDDIPQAIGSSAPMENIEAIVDELQIREYFQSIISAAGMPGKPDPAVYLAAAAELDISPGYCLVIEDAVHGVNAARSAGMRCLAITTTNVASDLSSADRVVNSLNSITLNELREIFC